MQLNTLERFALAKLLHDHELARELVHTGGARVLERVDTPSGFFALIALERGLREVAALGEREWKFRLKSPEKTAGYFVCWPDGDAALCLEAVICRGRRPAVLCAELFA